MSETQSAADIEHDLDQTRSRLGSHLSALSDRLSPGQILDDMMGYLRGSEGAAFGNNLLASVRSNPMPAAITGIGLAWLMAAGQKPATTPVAGVGAPSYPLYFGAEDHDTVLSRVRHAEGSLSGSTEQDSGYADRLNEVRGQALGLARHAQETAASFGQRVSGALAAAQEAVTRKAHDLKDGAAGAMSSATGAVQSAAQSAGGSIKGAMGSAAGQASDMLGKAGLGNVDMSALAESPVLLGALGLAAGALLGAVLPQLAQEEAVFGGLAAQARDAATELVQEGKQRGQQVAQAVTDQARDSLRQSGLTEGKSAGQLADAALSGELASGAKSVIQDVLRAGDEAIRKGTEPHAA